MALCWVPSHVGIAGNETADTAAKDAIISIPQADTQPLPYQDFYVPIKETIRGAWQEFWLNHCRPNKLREENGGHHTIERAFMKSLRI